MIRAVLFDMDGVLIDSEPTHQAAAQAALHERGLPVPDDADWERVFLGRPDRDGLIEWFAQHRTVADIAEVMAAKQIGVATRLAAEVAACEDGQWLARALQQHGVPLALVTGARRTELDLVLRRFDLGGVFAATVSADDVTVGKPDPEPYLRGAAALGIPAPECLVIEDAVPGLRAAEAAGSAAIVVDRLGRPERFAPTQPVEHLDEGVLETILARLALGT
ncbi:MAG TPA: HAD family phosphatase [Thermomicrobiales bacterium]|jgi:HAD superfamily hydrolase (TIGR01509 family)